MKPTKAQIEELLKSGDVYSTAAALRIRPISLAVLCKDHGIPWPGAGKGNNSHCTIGDSCRKRTDETEQKTNPCSKPPEIPKPDSTGRVTLKRSVLYELVWTPPITTLAKAWGISDVGLAKACRLNEIPKPGLGFWAKVQNGHIVTHTPLMREDDDWEIRITGEHCTNNQKEEWEAPIWDQEKERTAAFGRATISEEKTSLHQLTEPTDRSIRRCKADYQGMKRTCLKTGFPITCSEGQIDRALKIFDCLVKALEERKFTLTYDSDEVVCSYESFSSRSGWTNSSDTKSVSQLFVHVLQKTVRIELVEQTDCREYNDKEFPRKSDSISQWWCLHSAWLYSPNGKLMLRIVEDIGSRKSWRDGKKQRVEECIDKFIRGIVAAAESKQLRREKRERWEKEWQEQQKRREEERRSKEMEERRQKQLWYDIEGWEKAKRIRKYVAANTERVEALGLKETQAVQVQKWIKWAHKVADAWDPMKKDVPELSGYGKKIDPWKKW